MREIDLHSKSTQPNSSDLAANLWNENIHPCKVETLKEVPCSPIV